MEKELKISLLPEELTRFLLNVTSEPTYIRNQENRYYTSDALTAEKTSVRLRHEGYRFVLTMKSDCKQTDGYFECKEMNRDLDVASFTEFEADIYKYTGTDASRPLATFRTSRVQFIFGGFKLECDQVVIDHPTSFYFAEIECETEDPEGARQAICSKLNELGINWHFSTEPKLQRALKGY